MIRVTFTDGSVREFKSSTYSIPGPNDATFSIFLTKSDGSIDKQGLACPLPAARVVVANVKTIERVPGDGSGEAIYRLVQFAHRELRDAPEPAPDNLCSAYGRKPLRTAPEMAAALQPEPVTSKTPDLTKTNGEIIAERVFTHTPGKPWVGVNDPDTGKWRDVIYLQSPFDAAHIASFLRNEMAVAINGATAAEREACAAVADGHRHAVPVMMDENPPRNLTAIGIAQTIRARKS